MLVFASLFGMGGLVFILRCLNRRIVANYVE